MTRTPRPVRNALAVGLAAATLASVGLALPVAPAGAAEVTQVSACEWPDTAVRAVTFSLGGEASPADPAFNEQVTLHDGTVASTLPWWTIEEAAQFEILGSAPVVAGPNLIDVKVDVEIQASNATPASQKVTVPATVSVNYTPGLPYTEAAQQPHVISVDLDLPDTTWTRTGAGPVEFTQKAITVNAKFAPMASFGFIPVFNDCRTATFNETFDPVWAPPLVFETVGSQLPAPSFNDVGHGHTFFADIEWMADAGLSTGYEDGSFRPTGPVSRQAFAAFLYRLAGEPEVTLPSTPTFSDVGFEHTFSTAIEWAVDAGIAVGYPDGTFGPSREVSRQAASQWIYRFEDPEFTAPAVPTFSDVGLEHTFSDAIEWMASVDIANGYEDGTYGPVNTTTRQAAAAWIHRAADLAVVAP